MEVGGEGALRAVEHSDGEQRSNLNISDVFEAIFNADPSFHPQPAEPAVADDMYKPAAENPKPVEAPSIKIIEQPASKALRFRYECEGRSAGSIPGAHSTPENKTYPTIEITGHEYGATVIVSCVTKDKPYKTHPHNLVGRDLCKNGVCTVHVRPGDKVVSFSNLGIQCVKKKDIEEALRVRESLKVDPFRAGFSHRSQAQSIDLNAVRLCFQVFFKNAKQEYERKAVLPPLVSDVIYDKKAMNDLVITRLSHCAAPAMGGKHIILLCEKVAKEDIAVTFFEKNPQGQITWQADAVDLFVHKQVAICFSTPRYHNVHTTDHVKAFIQLRRPTDNERSEALPFEFIPMSSADPGYLKRKRQKPLSEFNEYMPTEQELQQQSMAEYYELLGLATDHKIKLEPRDKTPPHAGMASPSALPGMTYRTLATPSPHAPHTPHAPHQHAHHDPSLMMPEHFQWTQMENVNLTVPGPSHLNQPYSPQEINWAPNINLVPNMGQHSPNMGHVSPNMGHVSPNMGHVSPNMGHVSPNLSHMSPNMGQMSPNMGHMSPNMGHISPNINQMVPNIGQLSLSMDHNMGHVSPNLVQQGPTLTQLGDASLMETSSSEAPSISRLLAAGEGGDIVPHLNSTELSGLSNFLDDKSDS